MNMPRIRAIASLAAAATVTLALGACASASSRAPSVTAPAAVASAPTIRFLNDEREHVHVYLVGEQRQWLLGRVAPGARATLRLPEEALAAGQGMAQLAVIAGAGPTLLAARDSRALLTMAQPPSALLSQRWMLVQGQLGSLPIERVRRDP